MNMNDVKTLLNEVAATIDAATEQVNKAIEMIDTLMTDANTNMGAGEDRLQNLYDATSIVGGDDQSGYWIFNSWQPTFDGINQTMHAVHQINGGEAPGTPPPMYFSGQTRGHGN